MLPGWSIEVDTARDWLFLHISRLDSERHVGEETDAELADAILQIAAQHANYRLILEMADEAALTSLIVGQLVLLHKRVHLNGGVLRLCGLSDFNRDVLRLMGVLGRFQVFADRQAAIAD